MSRLEQNRVFHRGAMEELEQQSTSLMDCAGDVTDDLKEALQALLETAESVPAEAKDGTLVSTINAVLSSLDTSPYERMKQSLKSLLGNLTDNIFSLDQKYGEAMKALNQKSGIRSLKTKDLTELIAKGTCQKGKTSLEAALKECRGRWESGTKSLAEKLALTMTCLKGENSTCKSSVDPVNLSTGNFYYEKEDLCLEGELPIKFQRYYNAMDKQKGSLGYGWVHTYEERLSIREEGSLTLYREDGKEKTFVKEGASYRDKHTGREHIEIVTEAETEAETDNSHIAYRYRGEDGITRLFDKEGKLLEKRDQRGNRLQICHDQQERPARVSSPKDGSWLSFTYDKEGYLREVSDHSGRRLAYFVMEGHLSEATDAKGHTVTYRYAGNGKLRAIKNAEGVFPVKNEYDEHDRITKQKFPDQGELHYRYEDARNQVHLTERSGMGK